MMATLTNEQIEQKKEKRVLTVELEDVVKKVSITGLGDDDKVVMMQELGEDELDEATGGTAVSPSHIIRLSASSNSK
jgi:hypothetical protein